MLDRTSPVPLYHQIAEDLRRQIVAGSLAPGDALPTEDDLQRIYAVSRNLYPAKITAQHRHDTRGCQQLAHRGRGLRQGRARAVEDDVVLIDDFAV